MVETPDAQEPLANAKPPELNAGGAAANAADLVAPDKSATADVKEPVTESDLAHARTQLVPGEEILWTTRCSPKEFKNTAIFIAIFGAPILLFMAIIFIFLIFSFAKPDSAFGWFSLIFMLFVAGLFVAIVWRLVPRLMQQEKLGAKSIYVLSNRKLFISTTGVSVPMQTWDLFKIENVSSKAYPDGSGDLRYLYGLGNYNNGRWYRYRHEWLSAIPDVKSVEKLLADAVERCNREIDSD